MANVQKPRYYWKVVRKINGEYYSSAPANNLCIHYKRNQIICGIDKTPLFVFKTRQQARNYAKRLSDLRVIKVQGINEKPITKVLSMLKAFDFNSASMNLKQFTNKYHNDIAFDYLPNGTVGVDAVLII